MEQLLKLIDAKVTEIATVLIFSSLGFFIYLLSDKDPIRQRMRGALLGFLISCTFSPVFYWLLHIDNIIALSATSATLAIAGQFLPEMLTKGLRRFVNKNVNEFIGDGKDDN